MKYVDVEHVITCFVIYIFFNCEQYHYYEQQVYICGITKMAFGTTKYNFSAT